MSDVNSDQTTSLSRRMLELTQQMVLLEMLELVLEARQNSKDYQPLLEALSNYAQSQASGNSPTHLDLSALITVLQVEAEESEH